MSRFFLSRLIKPNLYIDVDCTFNFYPCMVVGLME